MALCTHAGFCTQSNPAVLLALIFQLFIVTPLVLFSDVVTVWGTRSLFFIFCDRNVKCGLKSLISQPLFDILQLQWRKSNEENLF